MSGEQLIKAVGDIQTDLHFGGQQFDTDNDILNNEIKDAKMQSDTFNSEYEKYFKVIGEGQFNILKWDGYPENGPKPEGPFRLLEGEEYISARDLVNKTNNNLHRQNHTGAIVIGKGKEPHVGGTQIAPVKIKIVRKK